MYLIIRSTLFAVSIAWLCLSINESSKHNFLSNFPDCINWATNVVYWCLYYVPLHYTASHSSASRFTMLALAEEYFCGSTPSRFLQIYNKTAARRNTISPMRPRMAGTFIVFFCSLLCRWTCKLVFCIRVVPFCSFTDFNPATSYTIVKRRR